MIAIELTDETEKTSLRLCIRARRPHKKSSIRSKSRVYFTFL